MHILNQISLSLLILQSSTPTPFEECQKIDPRNKPIFTEMFNEFNSNSRDTDDGERREKCLKWIETLKGTQKGFIKPDPSDIDYKTSGFQQFGEPCNPVEETAFLKDMYCILKKTRQDDPADNSSVPYPMSWFLGEWIKKWNAVVTNGTVRKFICNPMWFLECHPETEKCGCRTEGFLEPGKNGISLERGSLTDDKKKKKPTHRCVGSESTIDEEGTGHKFSSCEVSLPYFGICMINCQEGADCLTIHANVHEEAVPIGQRICCNKDTKCNIDDEKLHSGAGSVLKWVERCSFWMGFIFLNFCGMWICLHLGQFILDSEE